jgi:Asp-tRNA(Asn)/Glu-tRNA(Gln) amidotransferase A subunit family amidase
MARSWTLDHVGPMARSVEDLALCLTAIAGYDHLDPTSARRALPDYRRDLDRGVGGMRLGIPAEWAFSTCDPEIEARTRDALAVLREAGAEIVEVRLPNTEAHALDQVSRIISGAESASAHEENLDHLDQLSELAAQRLLANLTIPAVDYLRAMRLRHLVQLDFESVFGEVNAVIAPTTAAVAPRLDDGLAQVGAKSLPWLEIAAATTSVGNLAGIPALAIPAGFSEAGLPIGIQVMARPFAEATCFRVGAAFQALTDHHLQVPPLTTTIQRASR